MERIVKILMERDEISPEEAQGIFDYAKGQWEYIRDHGDILAEADGFCEEHFGLEPDYLDDFLYPGSGDEQV